MPGTVPDQNQSIRPNPEFSVAQAINGGIIGMELGLSVVNHNEIIACSLVFVKT
jgi:hypothetical protein